MRKQRRLVPLFLLLTCKAAAIDVPRYGLHEIQFPGPADPVAKIDATFTHTSGKTITMPAFWDGNPTWRCRFAPTELGNWQYSAADQKGTLTCTPGDNPGFIHPDGRHFRHDDGSHIFVL